MNSIQGSEGLTNLKELNIAVNQFDNYNFNLHVNLEKLILDSNNFPSLLIKDLPNLIELDTGDVEIVELRNLASLPSFRNSLSGVISEFRAINLESIEIIEVNQQNISVIELESLLSLKTLNLESNFISDLVLENLPSLETLNASQNFMSTIDFGNSNLSLKEIDLSFSEIQNLDLINFPNLIELNLYEIGTNLSSFSLENMDNLENVTISCTGSTIGSFSFTELPKLKSVNLDCFNGLSFDNLDNLESVQLENFSSSLNTLEFLNLPKLSSVYVAYSNVESLNLSSLEQLTNLSLSSNNSLKSIFVKNGNMISEDDYFNYHISDSPSLEYVCTDSFNINYFTERLNNDFNLSPVINSYCSFTQGGEFYEIQGNAKVDIDNNGCEASDSNYSNLQFHLNDGTNNGMFYGNEDGAYYFPIQAGEYTITPTLENLAYFTVSPNNFTVNFPTDSSPYTQDFCLTPNGIKDDLEVIITPITQARPGFDAEYKIITKNKGNTTLSGSFDFVYNDDLMDYVSSSITPDAQNTGNLTWNDTDLLPFESREIFVTMNLNTPTDPSFPLNGSDVLQFTSTINPIDNDETPNDNTFTLDQIVVNSYDPNDKTLLEGEKIKPELVGEYVHYTIRFENEGTASAVNVVVRDVINTSQFDISTLIPIDASHDYTTRIINGNEVEFIFENINLPFDDANNDGYITFKIKTLETLQLGDTFENEAEIYFDFNTPIITEEYVTTIDNEDDLATIDFNNSKTTILVYPNPTTEKVFVETEYKIESVQILNTTGNVLQSINYLNTSKKKEVNVNGLTSGVYFLRV